MRTGPGRNELLEGPFLRDPAAGDEDEFRPEGGLETFDGGQEAAEILRGEPQEDDFRPLEKKRGPERSGHGFVRSQDEGVGRGKAETGPGLAEAAGHAPSGGIHPVDLGHAGRFGVFEGAAQVPGGGLPFLAPPLREIERVPVLPVDHGFVGEGEERRDALVFTETVDRAPVPLHHAAEKGEDRLARIEGAELFRPGAPRAPEFPEVQVELPEGRVARAPEVRPPPGPADLAAGGRVAGADIGPEDPHHRFPGHGIHPLAHDRGETDRRLGHPRIPAGGEVLQVADQQGHVLVVEHVTRHDRIEGPARRVHAGPDGAGQGLFRVGRTDVLGLGQGRQRFVLLDVLLPGPRLRRRAPGAAQAPGAEEFGAVDPGAEDVALDGAEAASEVTVHAGEHPAVHHDVALHDGLDRVAVGVEPLAVDALPEAQGFGGTERADPRFPFRGALRGLLCVLRRPAGRRAQGQGRKQQGGAEASCPAVHCASSPR